MDADGCPDSVITLFDFTKRNLDQYWKDEAKNLSLPYAPPAAVTTYTQVIETPCGRAEPGNAFFCRLNRGLYFDLDFLKREFGRGDYSPVVIIAHEWGHLIQHTLNWEDPLGIRQELQADCYAGAYTRYADQSGMLEEGDSEEALTGLFRSGRTDVPWLARESHGSGGNRADAFSWGLNHGAVACTESVFMRKAGGVVPIFQSERYPDGSLTENVPLSVGDFTLVDVTRASEFLSPAMTDAIRGKYRAADGAVIEHWLAAHSTDEAAITQFDRWSQSYRDRGFVRVAEDQFTTREGEVTGRWIRFSKPNRREIVVWRNYQVVLVAEGPVNRTFDFARRHPL
jgi:hypothetical protein